MAKNPTTTETAVLEPAYTEVTLSRRVEIEGHAYRPGVKHVVDSATLAALGDAVVTKRPLNA